MKLFYLSGSTLPSGYANAVHVMKMCQAFAKIWGADVTLFAKAGVEKTHPRELFEIYGVSGIFKLSRTARLQNKMLSGPVRILQTLWRVVSEKNPPDLLYGRDIWTLAGLAGGRIPLALELHEIPRGRLQKGALCRIINAKNLRGVIVITEGLKYDLMRFAPYYPEEKILVAPDGGDVPQGLVTPVPLESLAGTVVQVGYAGSLYAGKGVELLVQMAEKMPEGGFHVFGGPQAEREKWESRALPPNIRFYGAIPHSAVAGRLSACDILVAPYLPVIHIGTGADIARWISPLKLFEYMALRKPIVCSDLSVLREVMVDGQNAMLVNPDNPDEWVHVLRKIQHNPLLAQHLSEGAYQDLVTCYSWERRAERIATFLRFSYESGI